MTTKTPDRQHAILGLLPAILLTTVFTAARAQVLQRPLELEPRITTTLSGPSVYGMPAFKESSVVVSARGTPGFSLSIRMLPAITMPGNKPLATLMQLVDPAAPAAGVASGTASSTSSSSASSSPEIVGPARADKIPADILSSRNEVLTATPVTIQKLLVFKGIDRSAVANPDTFFRSFEMEIQATRTGTSPIIRRFSVVLSNDDGPPAIVSISSEASHAENSLGDDFPPLVRPTGQDAALYATKTYKTNWVNLHRLVTVVATDFSVDGASPSADFRRFYQLVVEYQDGGKFVYPYDNLGSYPAPLGAKRLQILVPNIRRGSFRVYLRSPFGVSAPSQVVNFQSNQSVTNLPVAQGSLVAVNVDTQLYVGGVEALWGMPANSFQYVVLPAQPKCADVYALWDSATLGSATVDPFGAASAKFTHVPSDNSIVHSGNMPRISASAAGLGTVYAHWTAKMLVYVGECPQYRLQE